MLAGELYDAADPELVEMRRHCRALLFAYNQTQDDEKDRRHGLLKGLLGAVGPQVDIQPPFFLDYGAHLFLGDQVFMNFNCVILDVNTVHIGEHTMLGPAVQIYTATHPLLAAERIKGPERGLPIRIGKNCWLGGGVIVQPGITIGDNTTIGAGSVVTKDLPANVFAAGNPCRILREL
jgi:maltose O-acetyltransferase